MNPHLHGGKWSSEEELYAATLMEAFKAAVLPPEDIEEGTSLRKYLAKKLMCSPKRVSKKYEGTNYNGKQVYFKNKGVTVISPQKRLRLLSKMQILEHAFLTTLSETKATEGLVSHSASPGLERHSQLLNLQSIQNAANQANLMISLAQPQHQAVMAPSVPLTASLTQLQAQLSQGNIEGTIFGGLSGRAVAQLGQSSLSHIPHASQDPELARMAASLAARRHTLVIPSGDNRTLMPKAGWGLGESSVNTARLQQLEQSLLRNQQASSVASTRSTGTSPDLALKMATARRDRTNSLLLQRQNPFLEASVLDSHLKDTTEALMHTPTALPSTALGVLQHSLGAQMQRQSLALPAQGQGRMTSQLLATKQTVTKRPVQESAGPSAKRWRPN